MKKTSFRNISIERRDAIDPAKRRDASDRIFERLLDLDCYKRATSVFVFVSMGSEVETARWIPHMLEEKSVYVPFVKKGSPMLMTEIYRLDELEQNRWGILELPEDIARDRTRDEVDLVLTPGLAFDREGYRMGYGGGYYDRFFSDCRAFKLAVGFHEQLVDAVPKDEYDRSVDAFLSEEDYLLFP
ncbi:MAG: 5-formyltetrahydrofolate cyclo-ligase [Peptoniphilus sp.]|nr:5-formyltetrahydrofolate cyclo-ligase [Peptoniphilus sp.]MDD7362554.1 5-formyltetrahydrofolate cyclo-ligase [Bacillota bacterium]MDY6045047.1 5-formyltetrahydrofolate cyclo-ligase [Peptoniphilus sp.]